MRIYRKTATMLIAALILALHGVMLCAASVPECVGSFVGARHHQAQGCHEHQGQVPGESTCSVCCDSPLCAPRADLVRPADRSTSDRIAVFVPIWIATLPLNPAFIGGRLPRVSASPPSSPVRVFLIQKTLLI